MRVLLVASVLLTAALARGVRRCRFLRDGAVARTLNGATLARSCGVRTIEVDDPYYADTARSS